MCVITHTRSVSRQRGCFPLHPVSCLPRPSLVSRLSLLSSSLISRTHKHAGAISRRSSNTCRLMLSIHPPVLSCIESKKVKKKKLCVQVHVDHANQKRVVECLRHGIGWGFLFRGPRSLPRTQPAVEPRCGARSLFEFVLMHQASMQLGLCLLVGFFSVFSCPAPKHTRAGPGENGVFNTYFPGRRPVEGMSALRYRPRLSVAHETEIR